MGVVGNSAISFRSIGGVRIDYMGAKFGVFSMTVEIGQIILGIMIGILLGSFIAQMTISHNNREAYYCAYSNGYLDASMKYLQTTNMTEFEKATQIFGNSTREAFLGFMACHEIGVAGLD